MGLWSPSTIDQVIRLGDHLHKFLIIEMGDSAPRSHFLAADEMPSRPQDDYYRWPVTCSLGAEFIGLLYPPFGRKPMHSQLTLEVLPGRPFREFTDSVGRCFRGDVHGGIFTMNGRSSAIIKSPLGEYIVFDSHCKDAIGQIDDGGKASVLKFADLNQLERYLAFQTCEETMYSLTGVKVDSGC